MTIGGDPQGTDQFATQRSHRKARDRSIALLLIGIVALMPPIAGIFLIDGKVFGVPFPLVYVFVIWGLLVAGAAALASILRAADATSRASDTNSTEA